MNPFDIGYYRSDELRGLGFASVGREVAIARNGTIIGLERIEIGDNVRIDGGTSIICTTGSLKLKGRNHIGGHSHLLAVADLTIGRYSGTSQGVRIYTATDNISGHSLMGTRTMIPPCYLDHRVAPVTIGDHASVGCNSVLLPGCDLPDGAVVGALSLVTKPLDAWTIYHGNPARRVGRRERDVLELAATLDAETR